MSKYENPVWIDDLLTALEADMRIARRLGRKRDMETVQDDITFWQRKLQESRKVKP